MNPYDQAADDLGIPPQKMRRLPAIVSLIRDVTHSPLSEWSIEAEEGNLRRQGFVLAETTTKYDPKIGYITEYWGYHRNDHE